MIPDLDEFPRTFHVEPSRRQQTDARAFQYHPLWSLHRILREIVVHLVKRIDQAPRDHGVYEDTRLRAPRVASVRSKSAPEISRWLSLIRLGFDGNLPIGAKHEQSCRPLYRRSRKQKISSTVSVRSQYFDSSFM